MRSALTHYQLRASISILGVMVLMLLVGQRISIVHAAGGVGAACSSNAACNSGLVCQGPNPLGPRTCQSLIISFLGPETRANQILSFVQQSQSYEPMNIRACLGTLAVCQSQPVSNTNYWTDEGTATSPWFHYDNLRPSRSYALTVRGTENGATTDISQSDFVTWPGFGFTPTDSDAGCDGTTQTCRRTISWDTLFPGDTSVTYGPNPPAWTFDTESLNLSSVIQDMSFSSEGIIYAAGTNGLIMKRDAATWTRINFGGNDFKSISAYNNSSVWSAGANQALLRTNDGVNWTSNSTPPGIGSTDYFSKVIAMSSNTALLLSTPQTGGGSQVNFWNGSAWINLLTEPTLSCTGMTANSIAKIWVSCDNGIIKYTNNSLAFQPWSTSNAGSALLETIDTLDGKNVWVAGGGMVRKSTDGGISWNVILGKPSSLTTISHLKLTSPSSFLTFQGNTVFIYDEASNPNWTQNSDTGNTLGSNITSLATVFGDKIYIGGAGTRTSMFAMPASSTPLTKDIILPVTTHAEILAPLVQNTKYYYAVHSNSLGALAGVGIGSFGSFTTPSIDTIPPTLTLNPVPPATKTCPLTIGGTAADTAPGTVANVQVTIDGGSPIIATGTTTWTASIPCSSLPNGNHTISVKSFDGTNFSTPATASVFFDNTVPTVTITAPSPVNTSTVTASGTATDNDQVVSVQLTVNGGPRTAVTITAGASVPWSQNVTLNPGSNTINVYATDRAGNEGTAVKTVVYNVPTFTLSVSPASQTKNVGDAVTYQVSVKSINGFTGTINLTASGNPAGLAVSMANAIINPPANSTVTVNMNVVTTNATSGTYTVSVSGTSGTLSVGPATATLVLNVTPDFLISSAPLANTVVAGNSAVYTLHINGSSTYTYSAGSMLFTAGALPTGVTTNLPITLTGNPSAGGNATASLTLNTTAAVPANSPIVITATDGTKTHTVTLSLTATAPPDFTITTNTATSTVTAGPSTAASSTTFYNIVATAVNGFTGNVHLSLTSTPSDTNVIPTFSPNDFVPSTNGTAVTVNIHVDSPVACLPPGPCNFILQFTGTSGPKTKVTPATLVINPDTTKPTISNQTVSPDYNTVSISWQTDEPADSQITIYRDAAQTQVVTTTWNGTFCTTTCHSLNPTGTNLTPLTDYWYAIFSEDQAYTSTTTPPGKPGNIAVLSQQGGVPLHFKTTAAPDRTYPTFTLDEPADGRVIGGVTISGSGKDDNPLASIQLEISGPINPSFSQQFLCSSTNCNFTYDWNTLQTSFPNGNYTITAWAVSTSGSVTSTEDYTKSPKVQRHVTVDNDTTAPVIECLANQTICEPIATNLQCTAGVCSIDIHWQTNDDSTSEVEYGLSVDCAQQHTRPDGSTVPCAYTNTERYDNINPSDANPKYTDHMVRLKNLQVDKLYHYRITSCNVSNLCTN